MQVEKHYSAQEAAELLGISDDGVVGLIHAGEIVAVNVARSKDAKKPRWRIPESDLGRFLLSRRHPASMERPAKRQRKTAATEPTFFS